MTASTGFSEATLRQLTGIPVVKLTTSQLPHSTMPFELHTPTQRQENAGFVRSHLLARIREGSAEPLFRAYNTDSLSELLTNSPPMAHMRFRTYAKDIFGLPAAKHGPYTALDGRKRMAGVRHARGALLIAHDGKVSPRDYFAQMASTPADVLERLPARFVPELRKLDELHEAGHMQQGVSGPSGLYRTATEADFWHELDADLYSHREGQRQGVSAGAIAIDRDLRTLAAFNGGERHYWFSPQINGINASFIDTIAAHREVRLTTIFSMAGAKLPKPEWLEKWARAHNGAKRLRRGPEVELIHQRAQKLAERLENSGDDMFTADLQTLAHLNRHHEFTQPLAQDIARLTVQAATRFMPKLMGAD
jgi:hypothetical protein